MEANNKTAVGSKIKCICDQNRLTLWLGFEQAMVLYFKCQYQNKVLWCALFANEMVRSSSDSNQLVRATISVVTLRKWKGCKLSFLNPFTFSPIHFKEKHKVCIANHYWY